MMKWPAVGMCLAMVGMAVMPGASVWYFNMVSNSGWSGSRYFSGRIIGLALVGAVTGGVGLVIGAAL